MAVVWKGDECKATLLRRVSRAVTLLAKRGLEIAIEECPVDVGTLQESGRVVKVDNLKSIVHFAAYRTEGAKAPFEYGVKVEYGTETPFGQPGRKPIPPNPFMRRSVVRLEQEALPIIKAAIGVK